MVAMSGLLLMRNGDHLLGDHTTGERVNGCLVYSRLGWGGRCATGTIFWGTTPRVRKGGEIHMGLVCGESCTADAQVCPAAGRQKGAVRINGSGPRKGRVCSSVCAAAAGCVLHDQAWSIASEPAIVPAAPSLS